MRRRPRHSFTTCLLAGLLAAGGTGPAAASRWVPSWFLAAVLAQDPADNPADDHVDDVDEDVDSLDPDQAEEAIDEADARAGEQVEAGEGAEAAEDVASADDADDAEAFEDADEQPAVDEAPVDESAGEVEGLEPELVIIDDRGKVTGHVPLSDDAAPTLPSPSSEVPETARNTAVRGSWEDREDNTIYQVVVNHEEQYSIWPEQRERPLGWNAVNPPKVGPKQECLDYIKEVWTDMRPLSLRKKMEEAAREGQTP